MKHGSVRLATVKDWEILQSLLEAVGQLWSEEAICERIEDPKQIVMLWRNEQGGDCAFWFSRDVGNNTVVWGPIGGPIKDKERWWEAAIALGKASAEEGKRRWPGMNARRRRIVFKIWPYQKVLMEVLESRFGLTPSEHTDDEKGVRTYELGRKKMLDKATELAARPR